MIIAFDPGGDTGYAVLSLDEKIIAHGTFPYLELDANIDRFEKISRDYTVIEYVIPHGINAHNMMLADLNITFKKAFPEALFIRAGLWKPVMVSHRRAIRMQLKGATAHEIDAVCIALYALRHRKRDLALQKESLVAQ